MLIHPYSPDWNNHFELIKADLNQALFNLDITIEHVGSTAVPGLSAKPIIDIDIVYKDESVFNQIKTALESIGYFHNGNQGIEDREVFKRDGTSHNEVLDTIQHHLYVCSAESPALKRHLVTRDYLRNNEWARAEYQQMKYDLAEQAGQDKKVYASLKEEHINPLIDQFDQNTENDLTESMEVHHHAHHDHGKKNWKSYFWEFFMLFLAVFCGFLAELQLEHYIEHQREKKYVFRIYNDLKKDTAFYKKHANYQMGIYHLLDSAVSFLDNGTYKKSPDLFYDILLRARTTRYLEYYNTAFDQMKTSGNLRLIRKENILDSLLEYYYGIEKRALVADNRYLETVTETNKALNRFWDAGKFNQTDSSIEFKSPLVLFKASNASFPDVPFIYMLELKNVLFQRKLQLVSLRNFTLRLDIEATSLLKLIEEEYKLK